MSARVKLSFNTSASPHRQQDGSHHEPGLCQLTAAVWAPPQEISTVLICHDVLFYNPGTLPGISNLHLYVVACICVHIITQLSLPAPCLTNLKHSHTSEEIRILALYLTHHKTCICLHTPKDLHMHAHTSRAATQILAHPKPCTLNPKYLRCHEGLKKLGLQLIGSFTEPQLPVLPQAPHPHRPISAADTAVLIAAVDAHHPHPRPVQPIHPSRLPATTQRHEYASRAMRVSTADAAPHATACAASFTPSKI